VNPCWPPSAGTTAVPGEIRMAMGGVTWMLKTASMLGFAIEVAVIVTVVEAVTEMGAE
jgi:hypothetical protein